MNAFYSSQGQDSARVSIAREFGVDYVVYGPAEEALGSFSPEEIGWVTPVFTSGPVTVYQVSPERLAEAQP